MFGINQDQNDLIHVIYTFKQAPETVAPIYKAAKSQSSHAVSLEPRLLKKNRDTD